MANLPESASFDAGIYQIETTDPVLGGVDGISNAQAKGLANRTTWLKQQVDALNALKGKGIGAFSAANSYSGGDQVIYQKNIWQANTAITPGAFNPGNWTRQLGVAAESALANALPLVNGAAAVGTSTDLAREDHVHPVDTSRAPLASPALTGNPTAPTAAQFDNDTSIATTEFVQRALGNHQTVLGINATTTLTAANVGAFISLFGSGGYIITLPLGGSVPIGSTLSLFAVATPGQVFVQRQGTDTITMNGSDGLSGVDLYAGDSLNVTWSGVAWVATGSVQLKYQPGFSSSLAFNGYQKLPSGLIIQWGASSVAVSSTLTVALPITFPNAFFTAVGQSNTDAMTATATPSFATSPNGLGSIKLQNNYNQSAISIGWIAIGR